MVLTHTEFDSFQLREGQAIVLSHGNQRILLDHPGHIPMAPTPKEHDTASRDEHSTCRQRVPHSPPWHFFFFGRTNTTLATQAGNSSAHCMPQARRLSVKHRASARRSHHPLDTTSPLRRQSHKSHPFSSHSAFGGVVTSLSDTY